MVDGDQLAALAARPAAPAGTGTWLVSLPLAMAAFTYAYLLSHGAWMLQDGDTFWHIAAGRWILEHRAVPGADPFSYTMRGAPWSSPEWLSQVVYALAQRAGGWTLVVMVCAGSFALAVAIITRALLRWLEPIYAFLFAGLAIFMTVGHALARPHMLAMPLLVLWTIGLVGASDERRTPSLWLLPLMALWSNLHGGFTLGLALAVALGMEAALAAAAERRRQVIVGWALFLLLAIGSSMVSAQGPRGLWFTWQVLMQDTYALAYIGEWQSPNFHVFQPLALWLLGGLVLVLYQGLRLPPMRLLVVVGLLYLSLKHARNIELLGVVAPLVMAGPFGAQWRQRQLGRPQAEGPDRFFRMLARPAGSGAAVATIFVMAVLPLLLASTRAIEPPASIAPAAALKAVHRAGITGPVLNAYGWGGYLIYSGVPVFIDGRSDMYRDAFIRSYVEATSLRTPDALQKVLTQHRVEWTMLEPGTPAVALLDHLPGWRRIYSDDVATVHARVGGNNP